MPQPHTSPLEKAWVELQAFFKKWNLSPDEIIKVFQTNNEVYASWTLSGAMSFEERIILRCAECFALNEALLKILHEDQVHTWIKGPQSAPPCCGRSPIQTICEEIEKNPRIIRDITAYVTKHNH